MIELTRAVSEYPKYRSDYLLGLLYADLKMRFESPEYAGDRSELFPLQPGANALIKQINTLDRCLELSQTLINHLSSDLRSDLFAGVEKIDESNIEDLIEKTKRTVFFEGDDERDAAFREGWLEKLEAADILMRFVASCLSVQRGAP